MNSTIEVKDKAVLSNSDKKVERARKNLASIGITGKVLEEGYANGKTIAEIFRETAAKNSKSQNNVVATKNSLERDPLIDAVFDEWMQQSETIENLHQKIKRLEAKTKKQKARIAELEAQLAAASQQS